MDVSDLAQGNSSLAFGAVFVGGILASLLPCVYPLYPITANILKSRGKVHSSIYYMGIIVTYSFLGGFAGLTGGALKPILQLPETNAIVAVLMLILGCLCIDLFPSNWFHGREFANSTSGKLATFLMGVGAGLLSSPCVGPVVIAVLLEIMVSSDRSLGSFIIATSKMSLFGAGVGLPIIIFSILNNKLPKSGSWMRYLQWAFGILLFYFAFGYWEKAANLWNIDLYSLPMKFLASILLIYFTINFLRTDLIFQERFTISFLLSLLFVIWFGFPAIKSFTEENQAKSFKIISGLKWFRDKDMAIVSAKNESKPIFIDFYAEWCSNCKDFEKALESDREFRNILTQSILLRIEDTDPIFLDFQSNSNFKELLVGLPFFVVLDRDGNFFWKTSDYTDTKGMSGAILNQIEANSKK